MIKNVRLSVFQLVCKRQGVRKLTARSGIASYLQKYEDSSIDWKNLLRCQRFRYDRCFNNCGLDAFQPDDILRKCWQMISMKWKNTDKKNELKKSIFIRMAQLVELRHEKLQAQHRLKTSIYLHFPSFQTWLYENLHYSSPGKVWHSL